MSRFIKTSLFVLFLAFVYFFVRKFANGPLCESISRIDKKVVIVTGSNTGIGKETVKQLALQGGKVYLACRSLERANEAIESILSNFSGQISPDQLVALKLDLASFSSIRKFVSEFKKHEQRLDILINNAGIMWGPWRQTEDGFEETMGVNHFGTFLLTNLLLDMLKDSAPSRIVTVASAAHRWGGFNLSNLSPSREEYNFITTYAHSKTANILFSAHLAKILNGTGVTTYSLHPGAIMTDLQRHVNPSNQFLSWLIGFVLHPVLKDIEHGAQTTICCATSEQFANETGLYYVDCKQSSSMSADARDPVLAERLYVKTLELVNLA